MPYTDAPSQPPQGSPGGLTAASPGGHNHQVSRSRGAHLHLAAVAVLTLVLGGAGCAGRGGGGGGGSSAAPRNAAADTEWNLTVINRHSLDVSIHVITDGQRNYTGTVGATRQETFRLSPRLVGSGRSVRLEAAAIGSYRRLTSEALVVREGQSVEWTIENGLERASAVVW